MCMNQSKKIIVVAIIVGIVYPIYLGHTKPPKDAKTKHADKNKDGVVDKKEWHMEKVWEEKQKSKANTWWEQRADTNKDGIVSDAERNAWKKLEKERIDLNGDGVIGPKERRLAWCHAKSRINTPLEAQYDDNKDGWLEPAEAQNYLEARYVLIKTDGKAKVNSKLEEEYDADGDGVLSLDEAQDLKEDLGV